MNIRIFIPIDNGINEIKSVYIKMLPLFILLPILCSKLYQITILSYLFQFKQIKNFSLDLQICIYALPFQINGCDLVHNLNIQFDMADVSLDDLIQKDKEKNKTNRINKKQPNKKFNNDNRNQPRPNNNPNQRQQEDNRPFKKKFIKKEYEERNHPRDNRDKKVEKQNKPQLDKNEDDNREKQVRTLKVLGLSPEVTNEDLYKLFATEGALEKCLIEQDNFGRNLNTALVKYHSPGSATTAISKINGLRIMNCVLTVEPYKYVKK